MVIRSFVAQSKSRGKSENGKSRKPEKWREPRERRKPYGEKSTLFIGEREIIAAAAAEDETSLLNCENNKTTR